MATQAASDKERAESLKQRLEDKEALKDVLRKHNHFVRELLITAAMTELLWDKKSS